MAKASFVAPMLLQPTAELPQGDRWLYELKLDGYRIGFKTGGRVHLRSRNNNDLNSRYPAVAKAMNDLRDDTVVDGGASRWMLPGTRRSMPSRTPARMRGFSISFST